MVADRPVSYFIGRVLYEQAASQFSLSLYAILGTLRAPHICCARFRPLCSSFVIRLIRYDKLTRCARVETWNFSQKMFSWDMS